MSGDGEPQQSNWEKEVGLSEDTAYVVLYPARSHAEEWKEEAEEQGYGSRSKYLYELIQEARAFRQEGFLAYEKNDSEVEELQLQIEQLENDLEHERQKNPGEIPIEHEEFVTAFLTDRYQPINRLLNEVTSSGVLTGIVKDSVEEQLFELAKEDKVEYKPGYGWRLTQENDEPEVVEA